MCLPPALPCFCSEISVNRPIPLAMPIWAIFAVFFAVSLCHGRQLEIAYVSYGSLVQAGPATLSRSMTAWELAVEDLNKDAGNQSTSIVYTFHYVPARSCLNNLEQVDHVLAGWYYKLQRPNRVVVFLSTGMEPGCRLNDLSMNVLAAHWNTLSLNTMSGLDVNRTLVPTTFSLSSTYAPAYVTLCVNLLKKYSWTSVYIIGENITGTINQVLSSSLANQLTEMGKYVLTYRQVTPYPNTTFRSELTEFRAVSRVLFVLTRVKTLRRLLIMASSMNMTDGQYVYITMEAFNTKEYGIMTWFQNDTEDEVARKAFNSLLVLQKVRGKLGANDDLVELDRRYRQRTLDIYNTTFKDGEVTVSYLAGCTDAVAIAARVVGETWQDNPDMTFNGRYVADRMVNRTFVTRYGGSVYIDHDGTRMEPLAITHFNGDLDQREPFLMQYGDAMDRLAIVGPFNSWPGPPTQWPPPNEPLCGYNGRKNCKSTDFVVIAAVSGVSALLGLICFCAFAQRLLRRPSDFTVWWILDNQLLVDRNRRKRLRNASTLGRVASVFGVGSQFVIAKKLF